MEMKLTTILTFFQNSDFLYGLLAGFLIALLIVLLFSLMRRQPDLFEAFANDAGKVSISRQALEEQIQRFCEDLDDVGKCRVDVTQQKNILSTRIQMRLRSNSKLVGISGYLQEQIERIVRQNLGIENIGPIDIIVTGILPNHHSQERSTSIRPNSAE